MTFKYAILAQSNPISMGLMYVPFLSRLYFTRTLERTKKIVRKSLFFSSTFRLVISFTFRSTYIYVVLIKVRRRKEDNDLFKNKEK